MAKAQAGEDANTQDFMVEWVKMADKLTGLAEEDVAAGRMFSAGNKLKRPLLQYQTGERMQAHGIPGPGRDLRQGNQELLRGAQLAGDPVTRVEILYEGKTISYSCSTGRRVRDQCRVSSIATGSTV